MVDERTYEENHATVDINDEVKKSFLDYAMSVIVSRALPDVRDGMKPVQRRIVYSMFEAGMRPGTSFRKCSTVVGNVMGNYHPHGNDAIYDALVRLGQDFSSRYPLISPQGNFGTVDDPPAAMRYTESRLSPIAMHLLEGIARIPSTSRTTTAVSLRSRWCCLLDSRICWPTVLPGLRSEWRPTSPPTTWVR